MRQLQTGDVFTMARIIKSLDLKDTIKALTKDGVDVDSVGFDIAYTIIERASEAKIERELYDFVGSLLEYDADSIRTMSFGALLEKLKEYVHFIGTGDLKAFFGFVSKLTV